MTNYQYQAVDIVIYNCSIVTVLLLLFCNYLVHIINSSEIQSLHFAFWVELVSADQVTLLSSQLSNIVCTKH